VPVKVPGTHHGTILITQMYPEATIIILSNTTVYPNTYLTNKKQQPIITFVYPSPINSLSNNTLLYCHGEKKRLMGTKTFLNRYWHNWWWSM